VGGQEKEEMNHPKLLAEQGHPGGVALLEVRTLSGNARQTKLGVVGFDAHVCDEHLRVVVVLRVEVASQRVVPDVLGPETNTHCAPLGCTHTVKAEQGPNEKREDILSPFCLPNLVLSFSLPPLTPCTVLPDGSTPGMRRLRVPPFFEYALGFQRPRAASAASRAARCQAARCASKPASVGQRGSHGPRGGPDIWSSSGVARAQ